MNSHGTAEQENAAVASGVPALAVPESRQSVVIVGGGFGGLAAARGLASANGIDVTLLDKRNFHLFQPLLYQVATGSLSPGDVAAPLRETLRRAKNVRVLLGDVIDVDVAAREVVLAEAMAPGAIIASDASPGADRRIPYETLIVAAGLVNNYFGNDHWGRFAPGLKSIEDATELRSRLLLAFEQAERTSDPARRRGLLTFVIVGAGPTGVEMAGAISEIAADTLPQEFRRIAHEPVRIILLDAGPRVLAAFHEELSGAAARDLAGMGVDVRTRTMVKEIDSDGVVVEYAPGGGAAAPGGSAAAPGADAGAPRRERIDARVVIWAAGVRGTPLAARLAERCGVALTRQGTIPVGGDLTIAGHPEILAVGDATSFSHALERPLPGVAQVAIQQGEYAARLVVARSDGKTLPPFVYKDRGSMATIGRAKAVADLNFMRLTGFVAWLAWLFVHLMSLVGYENRVLVLAQWAWYYGWRRRSARLITTRHPTETTPTSL